MPPAFGWCWRYHRAACWRTTSPRRGAQRRATTVSAPRVRPGPPSSMRAEMLPTTTRELLDGDNPPIMQFAFPPPPLKEKEKKKKPADRAPYRTPDLTKDFPKTIELKMAATKAHPLAVHVREDEYGGDELRDAAHVAQATLNSKLTNAQTSLLYQGYHRQLLNDLGAIGWKVRGKLLFKLPVKHKASSEKKVSRAAVLSLASRAGRAAVLSLSRARARERIPPAAPQRGECSCLCCSTPAPPIFPTQAYEPWVGKVGYNMQPEVAQILKLVLAVGGFKKDDKKDVWSADGSEAVESVFGHATTRTGFNMLRRSKYFSARSIKCHKLATPLWNPLVAPDELPHLRLLVEAPARLVEEPVRQVLLPLVELLGLVGRVRFDTRRIEPRLALCRPRPQYPKLRQVLCLQHHKVLLTFGPSLRMNAGPRRALPGSPGFGSQKVAHPAQKPLLRSTAVSSQSLHFCPGKFGGAAQHMIRRNSKLLSALIIVTQWVFLPRRVGEAAIARKGGAHLVVEGSLGIFYSQSGQYPRIWIKMMEKLFRMGY